MAAAARRARFLLLLGLTGACVDLSPPAAAVVRGDGGDRPPRDATPADAATDVAEDASLEAPENPDVGTEAPADGTPPMDVEPDSPMDVGQLPDEGPPSPPDAPAVAVDTVPDPPVPGLILHWRFDELSGNSAADSSGAGRTGQMIGMGTSRPQPSTDVAPVKFANPRSREFSAAQEHGVVASPIPASIRANPELTVSAWFRATPAVPDGAAIVNLGPDYSLRLEPDRIEWLKRKGTAVHQVYALASWRSPTPLDGRWHHVAASSGSAGLRLFFDGVSVASVLNSEPPLFTTPDQVGAGHQPGDDVHQHTGHIDDVRIYGRVLSPAEVASLAAGNP
jgi:hypothetical protein